MQRSLFFNLVFNLKYYWKRFLAALLMVCLSNCLLVSNPLIFRRAVTSTDASFSSIASWTLLLIFVAAASAYFKYHMRIAFITISRDIEAKTRLQIFEKIQNQSSTFFDQHTVGELMSRLTNDISAYRDVLGPGIMYPIYFVTLVVPAQIALFNISMQLAALSLVPILTLPILILLLENSAFKTSLGVQKSLADMSTMAQETYSGIRIVKGYSILDSTLKRFSQLCQDFLRLNLRWTLLEGFIYPFLSFLTKTITIALVLLAGFLIIKGGSTLSAADFVSFMWLQSFIFGPVMMLGWVLPTYFKGNAAYSRLQKIYEEPNAVQEHSKALYSVPKAPAIELRHLSFSYPRSQINALSDIQLTIRPGSFIGITGPVGAGKSTLFRLLLRDYNAPKGTILLGSQPIEDYSLSALNQEMVLVEQHPFLFSKTIAENVRFGKQEASHQELEDVAELADLHQTILNFPEQYSTLIGERGVTLSGGQKQRLAIARALLLNRPILLLDDIFSSVDYATEKRILTTLLKNAAEKTVLIITHRISVLEKMDRVIYMKQGTIVEEGTPNQLLQQKKYYATLAELQRIQQREER